MDEDSSLQLLVAQRRSRPSFGRMISWEIDNSELAVRRRKREVNVNKKSHGDEMGDNSDDERGGNSDDGMGDYSEDDSEYFSAEERLFSDDSLSNDSYDEKPESTENAESGTTSVTADDIDDAFHSLDMTPDDKRRSRSKKQKKKYRGRLKSGFNYSDYEVPFRNVEDLDLDFLDDENSENLVRSCIRNVPTLFQICVESVSRRRTNRQGQSTSELPGGLRHVLTVKRRDQSFISSQLSWLYRLLGLEEANMHLRYVPKVHDETSELIIPLPARNIWSFSPKGEADGNHAGSDSSDILMFSNVSILQTANTSEVQKKFNVLILLSVVASAVDLMLPNQLSAHRLRHSSRDSTSESELIRKTTESLVYSVRQILKQRYPIIVKNCFDLILPYVFWARGNLRFAAEAFVKLAQTKEGREKAVVLCEAGRMYAQNEERETAQRYYREASGLMIMKAQMLHQGHDVKLQEFMLIASIYDQGLMTADKAAAAFSSWSSAMKYMDPKCPWSSAMRAADSFLCFHSGSTNYEDKEYLCKVSAQLEGMCGQCDMLLLSLSLVKALLGDASASCKAYQAFTICPSAALMEVRRPLGKNVPRKYTPWQPLIDQVNMVKANNPARLLKVIWRTQLCHPRVVNNKDMSEGTIQAQKDLNLRMTEDGYLTADLQMWLPPIRALRLDPYTGLHLHSSGLTEQWKSLEAWRLNNLVTCTGSFLVPTMAEVYRDVAGNCVQVLSPSANLVTDTLVVSKQITLFYTGGNGERAKLNLIPYLRDAAKQCVLEHIKEMHKPTVDQTKNIRGSMLYNNNLELGAEFCYRKGYSMCVNEIERLMTQADKWATILKYLQPKKTRQEIKNELMALKAKKKTQKGKARTPNTPKKANIKSEDLGFKHFGVNLVAYQQYKDTLFLCFQHNCTSNKKIYVFIGCTSRNDFLEPKVTVQNTFSSASTDDFFTDPLPSPKDHVIWIKGNMTSSNAHSIYTVYGTKGEVLQTVSPMEDQTALPTPLILGSMMYQLSQDKCCVLGNDNEGTIVESEKMTSIQSVMVGGGKVICITENIIYFLDDTSLKPLPVKMMCESSDLEVSADGLSLVYQGQVVDKVLEERDLDGVKVRLVLGVNAGLVFVDVHQDVVEVVMKVSLAGWPQDFHTISTEVGFLVTASVLSVGQPFYRENLYFYRYDGQLVGVLPGLGPGPRSFCVKFLTGGPGEMGESREKGWHVFLRDGHEGIVGVRLPYLG